MSVTVELHNTGHIANRSELVACIEHVFDGESGEWRVSILGSRENEDWEMKIEGPHGFERRYTLTGTSGEHEPEVVRSVVAKLIAKSL
jgi:hypothetical protein